MFQFCILPQVLIFNTSELSAEALDMEIDPKLKINDDNFELYAWISILQNQASYSVGVKTAAGMEITMNQ